jgi:hypothetical protein
MLRECGTDVNLMVPDILRNSVQVGRIIYVLHIAEKHQRKEE